AYGGVYTASITANAKSPAGFLGGLAAGFLAGYITVWMKKWTKNMPQSLDGMKPMLIFPILGLLIIAALMFFVVNPIFSVINAWITHFLNSMGTGNAV
ncbi:PTS transporter subunit EIIC, partial [Clostridioides difficile]|uniref:PTS transporter subunit EIIC n=2 Tax=Bacillota TaxID=1239 RepID=UPI00211409FE